MLKVQLCTGLLKNRAAKTTDGDGTTMIRDLYGTRNAIWFSQCNKYRNSTRSWIGISKVSMTFSDGEQSDIQSNSNDPNEIFEKLIETSIS